MSKKGRNIYEEERGTKRDLGGGASVQTKPGYKLKNSDQPVFDFMPRKFGPHTEEDIERSRTAVDESRKTGGSGLTKLPEHGEKEEVPGTKIHVGPDGFVRS